MRQPPVPATLIHHTKSDASLISMLQFGFLAVAHPTELLDFVAAGRVLAENTIASGGMICFSEPYSANARDLREEFGRFGIAVAGSAFRNHAIRKVTYLNTAGPSIGRLRRAFEKFAPVDLPNLGNRNEPSKVGIQSEEDILPAVRSAMVATGLGMSALHPEDPFVRLLSLLKYCQTSFHRWEREWRLTGPVISWIPSTPMGIEEARQERKKFELQMLRAVYQRNMQAPAICAEDRQHLMRLSFCPEPQHIRWVEAPANKVQSIRRKLANLTNVWRWPCGGIEVRPV